MEDRRCIFGRGGVEHRAGGKKSFEVQSGFWTNTRAVAVMGEKGSRVREGGGCAMLLWSRGVMRTSR